uniref:Dynamin stalk domain-containing protein n=1 Tax=Panagrolaimus superbus TaxID=310955 RepID=A0A914Z2B6_9BILA
MDEIHPTEGLKEQEILTAIRNAAGTRKALFIPENSFEYLVKKQLSRLEKPSLKCVDSVYEELLRVVNHCGSEMEDERTRFPRLYERIDRILEGFLSPKVSETKEFVKKVVQIQLAYINTNHPEFNDSELAEIFNELKDDQDDDKEKSKNFLTNPLAIKNKSATNTTFAATKFQSKNVAISFLNHQNLGAKTTEKIEEYQKNALTEREERDQMLIGNFVLQ